VLKDKPKKGRFTVEGFAQGQHHCAPCPPDALCKPCEETIFLSEARGAFKGPLSEDTDLRIHVHDATKLEIARRYRVTVEVCPVSPTHPLARVEIRGYQPL